MDGELDPRAAGARRFEGKVAVVTGAGQGIGAATARRLAQEGAAIVIGDMVEETSQRVRNELKEFGASCIISLGELSTWENAQALMAQAYQEYGRIDVLANVAGGTIWFQSFQYYLNPVRRKDYGVEKAFGQAAVGLSWWLQAHATGLSGGGPDAALPIAG